VLRHGNAYNPRDVIAANPPLKRALDMIASGVFSPDDPHRYRPLIQALTDGGDSFLVTADFQAYREAHEAVADLYRNPDQWTRKAVINTASMGWFSSDRTIAEYANEIWDVEPVLPE
jgi:starch phosphorylase